jgi:hypothetical protein
MVGYVHFLVNLQQGAGCFLICDSVPFRAPRRGTLVMSTGCSIVVDRWIGKRSIFEGPCITRGERDSQ